MSEQDSWTRLLSVSIFSIPLLHYPPPPPPPPHILLSLYYCIYLVSISIFLPCGCLMRFSFIWTYCNLIPENGLRVNPIHVALQLPVVPVMPIVSSPAFISCICSNNRNIYRTSFCFNNIAGMCENAVCYVSLPEYTQHKFRLKKPFKVNSPMYVHIYRNNNKQPLKIPVSVCK